MCLPWQMLGPLPHGRDTLHVCGRRGRMSRGKGGEERGGSGCVQGRAKAALCRVYQAKFGRAKATRSDRHFCPCPPDSARTAGSHSPLGWALPHLSLSPGAKRPLLTVASLPLPQSPLLRHSTNGIFSATGHLKCKR